MLVLLVAACSGRGGEGEPTREAPSAGAAISGFDDSQSHLAASLGAVTESALADPAAMRDAALAGLDAAEPAQRFAAVYGLTMTASTEAPASLDALREIVASGDATERLLAAGALASVGERDGVSVLIEALSSDAPMRNVDPSMTVWRYARANLLLFVGQDLGLLEANDAEAAIAAQEAWRAWWAENADALTWNAELGRYEAGAA